MNASPESLHFELHPIAKEKVNPSPVATMDSLKNWVSSFIKVPWNEQRNQTPLSDRYKEISRNFTSDITHAGFIHYLHLCWAKELGCELRPDILYYTIISELAAEILANPEDYKHLFSDSQEKETLVTVAEDGIIKADRLVALMRDVVKSPEFLETVCDTTFVSDVPNAQYARHMTFACMGTPFYDYMTTRCGIPTLDLIGGIDDWRILYSAVVKLLGFAPEKKESKKVNFQGNFFDFTASQCDHLFNYRSETRIKYFLKLTNIIANIIHYAFGVDIVPFIRYRSTDKPDDAKQFFSEIFDYGENSKCGSGHPDLIVHGWAKLFYIGGLGDESDLDHFSSHVNYVPFTHDDDDKAFCQVTTLAFSECHDNVLRPGYGIITYEVVDEDTYNKIAQPMRTDSHGKTYQPLSLKQCKKIVDDGVLYDPATDHYGRGAYVICDRCREDTTVCMGYGTNSDLCLPCVEKVKADWTRIYG